MIGCLKNYNEYSNPLHSGKVRKSCLLHSESKCKWEKNTIIVYFGTSKRPLKISVSTSTKSCQVLTAKWRKYECPMETPTVKISNGSHLH